MPALDTVAKVTAYARVLLQDTLEPYRYPDADLLAALNTGLMDARRLQAQLRDEEDVTDARAASFLAKFAEMMISPLTPQGIR